MEDNEPRVPDAIVLTESTRTMFAYFAEHPFALAAGVSYIELQLLLQSRALLTEETINDWSSLLVEMTNQLSKSDFINMMQGQKFEESANWAIHHAVMSIAFAIKIMFISEREKEKKKQELEARATPGPGSESKQ